MQELIAHQETINRQLARYGVKFGIYKNGEFKERLFPFDPLPRVIPAAEFAVLVPARNGAQHVFKRPLRR